MVVAAAFFFFAWFRTRRKMLFSDAHGSRWDVAGLALACLAGSGSIFGWQDLAAVPAITGLFWLPFGLAAILVYLTVAAVFRYHEATDSIAICLVSLATLLMVMRGVDHFDEPGESALARAGAILLVAAAVFVVATAQSFLTWRLEAFDFFLINIFQGAAAVVFCSVSLGTETGARTLLVTALVIAVGLFCTLARRRLQLTLAFGLLYGFITATVTISSFLAPGGLAPTRWLPVAMLMASLTAPAVLAAFPAIAEDRRRARLILPTVAFALAAGAIAVAGLPGAGEP